MLRRLNLLLILFSFLSLSPFAFSAAPGAATYAHPRLYFNADGMNQLRGLRGRGTHAMIWKNIADSADWCIAREHRAKWVGRVNPDPTSENLYDRFYAVSTDVAITEHLGFAYALSGDENYGANARLWLLSLCHEWAKEADDAPNSNSAYNVARIVKAIAVGYDLVYDRLSRAERQEIRDLIAKIEREYFPKWYQTEAVSGTNFIGHQAVLEWSSLGVVSLTFLGEIPEAQDWLQAAITKFDEQLLPKGLQADGASSEGGSMWASTMQHRIFFMAALRHVTDKDLFSKYTAEMSTDFALAGIAGEKNIGYDQNNSSVLLQPSFAQIDYYAPILLFLAAEYVRPTCQQLCRWDHSLGQLQKTRYITPNGHQMLFALGGYAYVWNTLTLRPRGSETRLSFQFPSVDETYLRSSWQLGDLVAAVGRGELLVHAGGQLVLGETGIHPEPPKGAHVQKLEDDGLIAKLESGAETNHLTLELNRPERIFRITRHTDVPWQWSCLGKPVREKNEIQWDTRVKLRVIEGEITAFNPEGFSTPLTVASGKIRLADPAAQKNPLITAKPSANNLIIIEIQMYGRR